ncbi:MAG: biotin/lipoyl-binding protein [Kiritimatiellae bacterium]|jgi:biotin carboxyl carrier protein|nr:biotin/lipoyl-binding protein [Kiritimatiellia bacterium]
MRTYKLNINDTKYEVEVKSFNLKTATLRINGKTLEVNVEEVVSATPALGAPASQARKPSGPTPPPSTARVANGPGPAPAGGDGIKAPIPGAILSIAVKEGDTIEAGQLILVMEARKMENQIKSTRAGKITKLCVQPGDAVAQGQDLVLLD